MSKYGSLSRKPGHAQWFLQRTLAEHDRSMDHPWMKMIYGQSFTVQQYAAWLARNLALFRALEQHAEAEELRPVHDAKLLRTATLEADLAQLLGAGWRETAEAMARASPAAARYLEGLEADAAAEPPRLLAHHFLQYNAVLSGGAYVGGMVSERLCLPHGAPGVRFYAFEGVEKNKGPARVQQYLRDFDTIEIAEEALEPLLAAMRRIYVEMEEMMTECFDLNPVEGVGYAAAKEGATTAGAPAPIPEAEQLELDLAELHGYTGSDGGRILLSLAGELLDVSAGREIYGPGGGYALLAGRDVTRCLATMCLEPVGLDDLAWVPGCAEDEDTLKQWREKLKAKYPVAGRLQHGGGASANGQPPTEGLRQRAAAASAPAGGKEAASGASQKCPISGKEGAGCPMAFMGIGVGHGPTAAQPVVPPVKPATGFMAGKSLVAAVQKPTSAGQESLLYRLCPLHWDDSTVKMLLLVAAVSWVSGIFVGWNLRRQLVS